MPKRFFPIRLFLLIATLILLTAAYAQDSDRPEGWQEESHGKVDPNYELVFSQDEVKALTIHLSAENYAAMQDNMTDLYGEPSGNIGGARGQRGPEGAGRSGRSGGQPPANPAGPSLQGVGGNRPPPPTNGNAGIADSPNDVAGPAIAIAGVTENPMWVEATLSFEGQTWTHVGVRYKGNSTLLRSWNSESQKLPLKLDFDEFEDAYPEIDNQRFFGFKQLSLGNAVNDDSFMRDAAAYQVMREMGLVAPAVTWYEVILEVEGMDAITLGLYTVIEVIDDTVIETAYGNDDGNIYEAEGQASTFAASSYDALAESFQKENNKNSDYSDIEAVFAALHADNRLSEPAAWREDLEAVFDTDTFLKWLAVNSAIQNWDTYGAMAHNYYLYHLPDTGQLSFIGWDYNEAFQAGRRGLSDLSHESVTDAWPLIRYLLDDPIYKAQYQDYLDTVITSAFSPENMSSSYSSWAEVITPYAEQELSEERFGAAVENLIAHSYNRQTVVTAFLQEDTQASQ